MHYLHFVTSFCSFFYLLLLLKLLFGHLLGVHCIQLPIKMITPNMANDVHCSVTKPKRQLKSTKDEESCQRMTNNGLTGSVVDVFLPSFNVFLGN